MKRLALLSVIALMLASAVFAPAAMAQEPGEPAISFSPDGELLASATWIDWKDIPITAVSFSPDGELLAFSPDGELLA